MAHSVVSDLSGETQEYLFDGHLPSLFISDGQNFEISKLLANDAAKGKLKNKNYNAENFLVRAYFRTTVCQKDTAMEISIFFFNQSQNISPSEYVIG